MKFRKKKYYWDKFYSKKKNSLGALLPIFAKKDLLAIRKNKKLIDLDEEILFFSKIFIP